MYKNAIEILNILEKNNHEAYIVGGYVRDKLLGNNSNDIDICTSATPKEIMEIFDITTNNEIKYGALSIIYKKNKYDVTTFRKELKYEGNRKPVKIKYIKDLKKDLLRRDFTINTFCINSKSEILDILNVKQDLDKKIIKTVGNPRYKLKEDALRMLRAIRFSANLDFEIDYKTKYYIKNYAKILKKLSYNRKKEELNKIFISKNKEKGKNLLLELKLANSLEIPNLDSIIMCNDVIGIWAQANVDNIYPFTKLEKEQMQKIRELLKLDITDPYVLYKYELYPASVVAEIKNINKANITKIYNNLPIHSKKDINIKEIEIAHLLQKKPGPYLRNIINDIEKKIVLRKLENNQEQIINYIIKEYK